jgi:hypothetical protein
VLSKVEMLPAIAVDKESEALVLPRWGITSASSLTASPADNLAAGVPPIADGRQDRHHDRATVPG